MANQIPIDELVNAIYKIKISGRNPEFLLLSPEIYRQLLYFERTVLLKDGHKLIMTEEEYYDWKETYGDHPEEYKYDNEFRDKLMVIRL